MSGKCGFRPAYELDILHTKVCKNSGHFWVAKVGFGQVVFDQLRTKVAICPLSAHF